MAESFPASVASNNSIKKENVDACTEFRAGWGESGETRAETVKMVRILDRNDPETNTTVRTPSKRVAFATGNVADVLNPTKPSPFLIPRPSLGMKETERL